MFKLAIKESKENRKCALLTSSVHTFVSAIGCACGFAKWLRVTKIVVDKLRDARRG